MQGPCEPFTPFTVLRLLRPLWAPMLEVLMGSAGAMLGPPGRREYADEKKRVGELSRQVGGADDVVALKMLRQHSRAALAAMPADSSGLTLVHKAASAGNSHCLEHLLSAALPVDAM